MSMIEVNQWTPRTGTVVSVEPGNTFEADGIAADAIASLSGAPVPVTGSVTHPPTVLTSGTSIPIDFSVADNFEIILSHNPTFTFNNLATGGIYIIYLSGNGATRTLTWPSGGGVVWSGTALTSLGAAEHAIVTLAIYQSGAVKLLTSVVYS